MLTENHQTQDYSPTTRLLIACGAIHGANAPLAFGSLTLAIFVLARRFASDPAWRGWALYSLITEILLVGFFIACLVVAVLDEKGILQGSPAGLLERIAISSAGSGSRCWLFGFVARRTRRPPLMMKPSPTLDIQGNQKRKGAIERMSLCGYRKLQADRARIRWLIGITFRVTQWADDGIRHSSNVVSRAFYLVAKYASLLFANLVNAFWLLGTQLMWWACRLFARDKTKPDRIKHVFVLMLENRSFDHLLGFSQLKGTDAITGQPTSIEGLDPVRDWNAGPDGKPLPVSSPADWAMPYDPGHEYPDVMEQLCGANGSYPHINNSGFVADYAKVDPAHPGEIMKCYAPEQLPVITTLAREFAVCDHWFSSMPGPTWPNRFFIHAASSGGLDHSPTTENIASSILVNGYKFDNGTIYDCLDDEGLSWTIYKGDAFPQALAISGMTVRLAEGRFRDYEDFSDARAGPRLLHLIRLHRAGLSRRGGLRVRQLAAPQR